MLLSCIPTLWRYFLKKYCQVLLLTLFGFLVLLMSTRLEDFAKFVSSGATSLLAFLFILLQIPYVMQIALPIASLIASFYLFQKISINQSLTSLRAAGISLFEIISPILFTSLLLSLFTFMVVLDLSASCHKTTKTLESKMRALNPLTLFHNKKLLKENNLSVDMKGSLQKEGEAKDFCLALNDPESKKLGLFIAKELQATSLYLNGKDLTLISALPSKVPNFYDHLIIENSKESQLQFQDILGKMSRKERRTAIEELKFSYLLAKKEYLSSVLEKTASKRTKEEYSQVVNEIMRRFCLSLSVVTFALLGISAGITFYKSLSKKRLLIISFFCAFFLLCYLGAKSIDTNIFLSFFLYTIPHLCMIIYSLRRLRLLENGRLFS